MLKQTYMRGLLSAYIEDGYCGFCEQPFLAGRPEGCDCQDDNESYAKTLMRTAYMKAGNISDTCWDRDRSPRFTMFLVLYRWIPMLNPAWRFFFDDNANITFIKTLSNWKAA